MLLNPFTSILRTVPGSRMLVESMGLIGASFADRKAGDRTWTIINLFAPIHKRSLGGIRAKLEDQKGFITFCNQRDLELLLGLANPGDICPWTDKEYPEVDSHEFYGMCVDEEDLKDDLFGFELSLRAAMAASPEYPSVIPYGHAIERFIHLSSGRDVFDRYLMLWDCDPETGMGPDPRFETLPHRWTRFERAEANWSRV
jgi:hypothetical protein